MGIRKWKDRRGRARIYLSKQWPDGSRFRRVMPNKTVARKLQARIDNAVAMGTWTDLRKELSRPVPGDNPTIGEFTRVYLEHCQGRNRDMEFKTRNTDHIVRVLGSVRVKDLRRHHADLFAERRLAEGVRTSTANRGLAVLKHMLSVAVEREYLNYHPLLRYRMLAEPEKALRVLTYPEYRRLIEAVAEEDVVIGTYIAILGETGMRKSEGLRLKWPDIHNGMVAIGKTKSGKVRSVPLSDLANEWLHKLVRFIDTPQVFVNPQTRRPWKDPRGPFCVAREKAGLDWVSFHDLRHFRATQWLILGLDTNTVRELLGHSTIQTTMRYLHYVRSHAARSVLQAQKREADEWQHAEKQVDDNWTTSLDPPESKSVGEHVTY